MTLSSLRAAKCQWAKGQEPSGHPGGQKATKRDTIHAKGLDITIYTQDY